MALLGLTEAVPSRKLVRPPGALPEEQFLQTCMRCGACTQVCPIRTIKRADLTYGFRNAGTPRLDGYCMIFKGLQNPNLESARDWKLNVRANGQQETCFECIKICPSGALRAIAPDVVRIGTAVVNKDLCKAWRIHSCTHDCMEVCPFDAIDLTTGPIVDETRCVGCNQCNFACVSETIPRAIGIGTIGIGVPS